MAMFNNQILFGEVSKPSFPLDLPWTIPLDTSSLKKICVYTHALFISIETSYNIF